MKKRVITGVIAFLLFFPVLLFSGHPIGKYGFMIVMGLLAFIALHEACDCFGLKKNYPILFSTYFFAIAVTLITVFLRENDKYVAFVLCAGFLFLFLVLSIAMFNIGTIKYTQAASLVATSFYVICGFLSIIALRYTEFGNHLFLLIFIGAWSTDTGAYFVGVIFGKHKLIPSVSPKKTVEGAFGGILGCVLGYLIFGLCISYFYNIPANYIALACVAAFIAIISQIGDLIASYIKREQGIKDFGFVLPGHGGILDRFDSIIAVAPAILGIVTILGVKLIG